MINERILLLTFVNNIFLGLEKKSNYCRMFVEIVGYMNALAF